MTYPDCDKKIIIAIDGYSSSGKSTMAKQLARRIGYRYIDSGAMYRAVTLYALNHSMIKDGKPDTDAITASLQQIQIMFEVDGDGKTRTLLNGEDVEERIRRMDVADNVSPVSAIPEVRHYLTSLQQKMGEEKGIVMDGRDIGTTVFPRAELKIFVDASPETRAMRRLKELQQKGIEADYDSVCRNIRERDHIDRTRKESPLRMAEDALRLDNGSMSISEQDEWLLGAYNDVMKRICTEE